MRYRIFNIEAEAIAAEAAISQAFGYAVPGTNAATGEIVPDAPTVRWAVPVQINDGRWVFPSPDDEGEESASDWWHPQTDHLDHL